MKNNEDTSIQVDTFETLPIYTVAINRKRTKTVSGYDLWKYLEVKEPFSAWLSQSLTGIAAIENKDFTVNPVTESIVKQGNVQKTTKKVLWFLTYRTASKIVISLIKNSKTNPSKKTLEVKEFLKQCILSQKLGFESPRFSSENFELWAAKQHPDKGNPPHIYAISMHYPGQPAYYNLFDHGFIADRACIWGGPELDGCEIAIVSRTYVFDEILNNLPKGLRCVKLKNFPTTSPGTVIATVIDKPSPAANVFLRMCCYLPVEMFAFALPITLIDDWKIDISVPGVNRSQFVLPRLRRIKYISDGSRESRNIESIFGEQPDWWPSDRK